MLISVWVAVWCSSCLELRQANKQIVESLVATIPREYYPTALFRAEGVGRSYMGKRNIPQLAKQELVLHFENGLGFLLFAVLVLLVLATIASSVSFNLQPAGFLASIFVLSPPCPLPTMGAALGVLAAEEIIALVVLGVMGTAAAVAGGVMLATATQNCSCGAAPTIIQANSEAFKITAASDISALSMVSAALQGQTVRNSKVPFNFSFVIGKGGSSGKPAYHAGVLIEGDFDVSGSAFNFMFVDRWKDGVVITFYETRQQAFDRLRKISVQTVSDTFLLTDCSETPQYSSLSPATAMATFVHEELKRVLDMRSFSKPEDLRKMKLTNCIVFAIRAGILLAAEEQDNFLKAALTAIDDN